MIVNSIVKMFKTVANFRKGNQAASVGFCRLLVARL